MKRGRKGSTGPVPLVAIATDLDGTLTLGGRRLKGKLRRALLEIRRAGVKLVLVTGRCTKEARGIVGPDLFDAMVTENGAVLVVDGIEESKAPAGWANVRERLAPQLGEGCEKVIISAEVEKLAVARRLVRRQASIVLNKDRLMVVPLGVDKGRGLVSALSMLGLPPERTACLGDGENDASMFDVVGIRVALGNSVDELKRRADFVTTKEDGDGVVEAIGRLFPERSLRPRGGEQ